MKSIFKRLSILFLLFIFISGQYLRAQSITLYGIHFPPHVIDSKVIPPPFQFDQSQIIYGLDADLVRAAFESQGVYVQIKIMSWRRIMRNVEQGIILGAITCRDVYPRNDFALFSSNVTSSINTLVTRKHFLDNQEITLNTLKGYQNVAVEGWSQTNILNESKVPYSVVSDLNQGLNLVSRRGKEVLVTERDNVIFIAKQLGIQDQFSFYDLQGGNSDFYPVCFSKEYPDAKQWRDILNKGLEAIKLSGLQEEIFQRYHISKGTTN